jgi:hypothetical protein
VQIVGKNIGNMFMNMELEKKNLKKHKYDNKNKFHASLLGNDKTKI